MWTKAKNLQRQCIVAEQRQLPARSILDGGFRRWGYRVRRQLHRWSARYDIIATPSMSCLVSSVVFESTALGILMELEVVSVSCLMLQSHYYLARMHKIYVEVSRSPCGW